MLRTQSDSRASTSAKQQADLSQLILEQVHPDVVRLILQHHAGLRAVIDSWAALARKLAQVPTIAHATVCRACMPDSEGVWSLEVDDAWDVALLQLEQAPECHSVRLHVPAYIAHSVTTARATAAGARIAAVPRVQALRLSGAWRVCALAAVLPQLRALTALDLLEPPATPRASPEGPCLTSTSVHLMALTRLQRLSTVLTSSSFDAIHFAATQLPVSITELSLGFKSIDSFVKMQPRLGRLNQLKSLSVFASCQYDQTANLAQALQQLLMHDVPTLQQLHLYDDEYEDAGHILADTMTWATALTSLSMAGTWVSCLERDALEHLNALPDLPNLSLSGRLGIGHLKALGARCNALKRLTFTEDGYPPAQGPITRAHVASVACALGALACLTSVTFTTSATWEAAAANGFVSHQSALARLQHLELPIEDQGALMPDALTAALVTLPHLRAITYDGHCEISMVAVARCATQISSLRSLSVKQLPECMPHIAAATQLTQLQLEECYEGYEGREYTIAQLTLLQSLRVLPGLWSPAPPESLALMTRLTSLEVYVGAHDALDHTTSFACLKLLAKLIVHSEVGLDVSLTGSMFAQLAALPRLSNLCLTQIAMNCQYLSDELGRVSSLVNLELVGCILTDDQVCLLAPTLSQLPCLQSLDIKGAQCSHEGLSALALALGHSETLRNFEIKGLQCCSEECLRTALGSMACLHGLA